MVFKILKIFTVFGEKLKMDDDDKNGDGRNGNNKVEEVSMESDSFNLLLNKPEANALKTRHCMKEDCLICKALINLEESQSSVVLPVQAKDCRELEKDSNVGAGWGLFFSTS